MQTIACLYSNFDSFESFKSSIASDEESFTLLGYDNRQNSIDYFEAIRNFRNNTKNKYLIIAHQDVNFRFLTLRCLHEQIQKIQLLDSSAALFGCAGISHDGTQGVGHYYDSQGEHVWGFPKNGLASSLDEFFLVLDCEKSFSVSENLSGFHFYGTDLCINAAKAGYSSYVIDFPVLHNCTPGKIRADFFQSRYLFEKHLQQTIGAGVYRTTCSKLYAGRNPLLEMFVFAQSIAILDKPNEKHSFEEMRLALDFGFSTYGHAQFRFVYFIVKIHLFLNEKLSFIFYPIQNIVSRLTSDLVWWRDHWKSRVGKLMQS